jgi:hypothetical protein
MGIVRRLLDKIADRELVLMDLVHPGDVTRGSVRVCSDDEGDAIVIDEISMRAVLHRMDALEAEKVDDTTIRVDAWRMACAIDDRYRPIHESIPNTIAAAPKRDSRGLRRLRDVGYSTAARGTRATVTLNVPESVAGWIGIRNRKAGLEIDRAWG